MKKRITPPGPRRLPVVGNILQFARDPLGFLTRCARQYGDVVELQLPQGRTYLLSNPADIEFMLSTTNRNFKRDKGTQLLRPLLGNGLVVTEGEYWLKQRRLLQPAFHKERIKAYTEIMVDYATRTADSWQEGQVRDTLRDMQKITQQIVTRLLFSAEVSSNEATTTGSALDFALKEFQERLTNPFRLPESAPTPRNVRYRKAVAEINSIIDRIIKQRREEGDDRGDLISTLLGVQDEEGNRLSDQQLRDELVTFYLAGYETTALTLSWAWALLAQHPEVEARLVEELETVLGGRAPNASDLPRLVYTDMVVKETLRLYPVAWFNNREVLQEVEVGGYKLPEGLQIWTSPWIIHRDPRFYENPEEFRPERWESEAVKQLPRYAYMPFGGGPRQCIGNTFAQTEAVMVLATVAQRWGLKLAPGTKIAHKASGTLTFKYPLLLEVTRRANAGGSNSSEVEEALAGS